ncbi:MAG TPA: metal ABC transporter permease [Polyangia bacterium]
MTDSPSTLSGFLEAWTLFRDPVLCALMAGAVLGFLGVFVVLRRMIFVSVAVTQSSALGVALAFFAEIHLGLALDPIVGAIVLSLLSTVLLSYDPRRIGLPRESVLGFAFAFTGAVTILIEDRIVQEAHDIHSILFGSAVLVRPVDLVAVAVTGALVMLVHLVAYRGIVFASFDADVARVQGVPVRLLSAFQLASIGAMAGVAARALGALPVFALATLPALMALVLGVGLKWVFVIATVGGALSGGAGYLFAFLYEFPVGGSQTVIASALFGVAFIARAAARWGIRLASRP